MGITVTVGRRVFTSTQYEEFKKNKPHTLHDMRVCFSFGKRKNCVVKKGRKAAAFRSLQMTNRRLRYDMQGKLPGTQTILSMKHMDLPADDLVAKSDNLLAASQAVLARLPKLNVKFKG